MYFSFVRPRTRRPDVPRLVVFCFARSQDDMNSERLFRRLNTSDASASNRSRSGHGKGGLLRGVSFSRAFSGGAGDTPRAGDTAVDVHQMSVHQIIIAEEGEEAEENAARRLSGEGEAPRGLTTGPGARPADAAVVAGSPSRDGGAQEQQELAQEVRDAAATAAAVVAGGAMASPRSHQLA